MGFLWGLGYGTADALISQAFAAHRRGALGPAPRAPLPPVLHPTAALGICGIQSLRHEFAVRAIGDALHQLSQEHPDLLIDYAEHVDVGSARGRAHGIVRLGERTLVVQGRIAEPSMPLVDAVAEVDDLAVAALALAGHRSGAAAVVCVADSSEEPRDVPAPSGRIVTVTGLPWLAGIVRRIVLPGPSPASDVDQTPGRLGQHLRSAIQAAANLHAIYSSLLADPWWWVVPQLKLGDGIAEPIELAAVGPTGAFALHFARDDPDAARELARSSARRLQAYLPTVGCTAVVVDRDVGPEGAAIAATANGNAGWAVRPDRAAAALRHGPAPTVGWPTIRLLNAPAPGWYRTVTGPPGAGNVGIGWRS